MEGTGLKSQLKKPQFREKCLDSPHKNNDDPNGLLL